MFKRRACAPVLVAAPDGEEVDLVGQVEAIRRGWEAFNRRDFDSAVQYLHPDGEAFPAAARRGARGSANAGCLHGREEVRLFLERVSNTWHRVAVELREVIVGPDGRMLAIESWHIHDRNGIELETMVVTVYAFRAGLVVRLDGFLERAEALEALGTRN
jgi:ketosteroid isomerase-like protein